ncbi:MAG: hypothetical protein ABEJ23_01145 [Haloarculaceae archaeon]
MNRRSRPRLLGSSAAVLVAATCVALVATAPAQHRALAAALVGALVLVAGVRFLRAGHRLPGGLLALAGVAGVAAAFPLARAGPIAHQFELYPGLAGVALLGAGLAPVRSGWERRLVTAGSGGLLAGVVASGVVHGARPILLLGATVASVVAWDVAEQAINLGEHVGTDARAWPAELAHGAVGGAVGGVGAGLALAVSSAAVTGVSLGGLAVLLGATIVLTAALYH